MIYAKADITDEASVTAALDTIEAAHGALRAVVHCAGRGGDRVRILDRDGNPGSLDTFAEVVRVNLVGTYNVLRLGAARIARTEPVDGERGAIVLTASVAAFDGQIGQTSYTAAKAGVHGITLVAARDLASRLIRVNTIAPGVFDTPMLARLRPDIREALERACRTPADWERRTTTPGWRSACWRTPTSTARRSAWTAPSGCRRANRYAQPPQPVRTVVTTDRL